MRVHRSAGVAGVLLAMFTTGSVAFVGWARQQPVPSSSPAVARVNDAAVTAEDLELRLAQILPVASYHGHIEEARLRPLRRAALDELILDELIYEEARAAGRSAPPAAVDEALIAVEARFGTAEAFAEGLKEAGITERDFRERLARTELVRLARETHARQVVTDADVEAHYRENASRFKRPEQVHLLEILIRAEPGDPTSAADAERKARAILARLRRGEAFDRIARAESEDEYRVKDGDMGFVHRGRLDADFEASVFAAEPGRFLIGRTLQGFQVFKVVERQPPLQLTLAEARPLIAERLQRQRREEAERRWHAALRARARIEILDPVLSQSKPADLPAPALRFASRPRATGSAGSH
jgi:parvulin-like peptidyl-prolyl isomerase